MNLVKKDSHKLTTFFQEANLFRMPLFVFDKHMVGKNISLKYLWEKDGKKCLWQVSPNVEYGLGGAFDDAVLMAIWKIISDMKKPVENPINIGSLRNIARIMGYKKPSGKEFLKIKTSLYRLASLTLITAYSFFSKEKGRYLEIKEGIFHLIDKVYLSTEDKNREGNIEENLIWLNHEVLSNINEHYVRPIDLDFYFSLKHNITRGLFKILSESTFASTSSNNSVRYKYSTICSRLVLKQHKHLSLAKQQLDPAHRELVAKRFLASFRWDGIKNIKHDWYIQYIPEKGGEIKIITPPKAIESDTADKTEKQLEVKPKAIEADKTTSLKHQIEEYLKKLSEDERDRLDIKSAAKIPIHKLSEVQELGIREQIVQMNRNSLVMWILSEIEKTGKWIAPSEFFKSQSSRKDNITLHDQINEGLKEERLLNLKADEYLNNLSKEEYEKLQQEAISRIPQEKIEKAKKMRIFDMMVKANMKAIVVNRLRTYNATL